MSKYPIDAIPVSIIVAAMDGDAEALSFVLDYYKGYIRYLSMRPTVDSSGRETLCVDEHMQHRLEAKLVSSIVTGFRFLQ